MDVVTVDDSDTSQLQYSEHQWFLGGSSSEYNSTTHGSFSAGATMTFKFNGSSVAVYGTISGTPPAQQAAVPACNSTYTVDGASPAAYTAPFVSANLYQARLFASPPLADGPHTLVLAAACAQAGPWFWFDYVTYVPARVDAAVSSAGSASASATSTTSASSGTAAPAGPRTGLLVAAIATPLAAALLLALGALWWRTRGRRRRRRGPRVLDLVLDTEDPPPGIEPFTARAAAPLARKALPLPPPPAGEKGAEGRRAVAQHVDGGVRLDSEDGPLGGELPPAYGRY